MKLHESIEHGASKNKSMGMRDAHAVLARALVHTFQSSELALVVFGVMKKFVDQVCPQFPALRDVNPSVLSFHVPSMKPASDLPVLTCFSHCITHGRSHLART